MSSFRRNRELQRFLSSSPFHRRKGEDFSPFHLGFLEACFKDNKHKNAEEMREISRLCHCDVELINKWLAQRKAKEDCLARLEELAARRKKEALKRKLEENSIVNQQNLEIK